MSDVEMNEREALDFASDLTKAGERLKALIVSGKYSDIQYEDYELRDVISGLAECHIPEYDEEQDIYWVNGVLGLTKAKVIKNG